MDEKQMRLAEELLFTGEEKPSFAKKLYFGEFDAPRVLPFPHPEPAECERIDAFMKKLFSFMDEKLDPDKIDREATIPRELIKGLGDLGLMGLTIPKSHGGQAMSQVGYCQAMENVARRCSSTALLVNAHQSIGLKAILLFGTPEQQQKWLPMLSSGDGVAAFSLTEPGAGSDAAGVKTRAEYDPEKKVYRINGKKQWTTNGSIASVLTLMAVTEVDGEEKITAFLVEPDLPGITITAPALEKVGMRGTHTTNFTFENVEVPEECILGKKGKGLRIALTVLDYGRTTFGATCTGTAKECYERALEHAKTRHQFERPLASFPLVKEKLANMAAMCYAMDATTYLTAGLVDDNQHDIMLESAILKVFASECQWQCLYDALQIFGGRSFFTDLPFERMMRDARLNMIGEGANEVLRAFIGVVGMRDVGKCLEKGVNALKNPLGNFSDALTFGAKAMSHMRAPAVPVQSEELVTEASQLGRSIRRFGVAITKLLGKYREKVVEQQLPLNRIATAVIGLYTTTAVISKLDSELEAARKKGTSVGDNLAIGKFYCRKAFAQIDKALDELNSPEDEVVEALSDQLTGVKGPW